MNRDAKRKASGNAEATPAKKAKRKAGKAQHAEYLPVCCEESPLKSQSRSNAPNLDPDHRPLEVTDDVATAAAAHTHQRRLLIAGSSGRAAESATRGAVSTCRATAACSMCQSCACESCSV